MAAIRWKITLPYIGSSIIVSRPPAPADLILVLGGDFWGPRVLTAADLASHRYAPKVLISGTRYRGRPEGELAIEFLAKQGYSTNSFESFEHSANSTVEEAIALRPELKRRGVKRVILVTAAQHSLRALIVLRLACPDINFLSVPATNPSYNPDRWWKDEISRSLLLSEWGKIVTSLLLAYPEHIFGK